MSAPKTETGLPRSSPSELVEDLRELARISFVDTYPDIPEAETAEAEAADFIEEVEAFLLDVVNDGGPFAERATKILSRQ